MIPWSSFNSSELRPDRRVDLNEHNLSHFAHQNVHSPLEEKMNFSMLESAHERQFAMAQLGTNSVGFEAEHSARIRYAFKTTKSYFTAHPFEKSYSFSRPSSPHVQDLFDFRLHSLPFEPLPSLEISDHDDSEVDGSPPPEPVLVPEPEPEPLRKPATSFLTLQQLMNPEPTDPPQAKRKETDAVGPTADITADDSSNATDADVVQESWSSWFRVKQDQASRRVPRILRESRMRRANPDLRTYPGLELRMRRANPDLETYPVGELRMRPANPDLGTYPERDLLDIQPSGDGDEYGVEEQTMQSATSLNYRKGPS